MKVSVVVPAFNEEKYIKSCLESLTKQIVKPDEIIMVDNNCTDSTVKIAKEFNVIIVKEEKQGVIQARNRGFNEAKYDIIARCDADTIVPIDWIKRIKQNFLNKKIDALLGLLYYYDLPIKYPIFCQLYIYLMRALQGFHTLIGPNMSLTKKIWNKIKTTVCDSDRVVHEDIDLACHIHQVGGTIQYDSNLIVATSIRRIKKDPLFFFTNYPWRVMRTLIRH